MKFTVTRLCGGKALMAASSEAMDIDLKKASDILCRDGFDFKRNEDDLMLIMEWKDMEVTACIFARPRAGGTPREGR